MIIHSIIQIINFIHIFSQFLIQIKKEPKILLFRFSTVFTAVCIFCAIYEVTLWSIEFAENKDQVFISIKSYNHHSDAKYPTFSICFKGSEFHWYRDVNIFNSYDIDLYQYENMLKGNMAYKYELNKSTSLYEKVPVSMTDGVNVKFDQFHVQLNDIVNEVKFVTNEAMQDSFYSKESNTKLEDLIRLSYQTPDRICFSRVDNDPLKTVRTYDILTLDKAKIKQMMYYYTEVQIFIHHHDQLISSLDKPKYTATFPYLLNILHEFDDIINIERNNILEFKISQSKVLNKRENSREIPCNNHIQNYDKYLQLEAINALECVPVYWKDALINDTNFKECMSSEKLSKAYQYFSNLEDLLLRKDKPCREMYLLSIDSVNNHPSPEPKDIAIAFHYTETMYEEITYSKETMFENWLSNVGGFVGIFLGYSMLQFPAFLIYVYDFFHEKKYKDCTGIVDILKMRNL